MRSINIKYIGKILGALLITESLFMLIPFFISMHYKEAEQYSILLSVSLSMVFGLVLFAISNSNSNNNTGRKESYLLVSLAWIILPIFGALPFYFSHAIPDIINALFESYSGFTTTGSSILKDIESLPNGILFWRSETHWIGGIGIVVLVVSILPLSRSNGAQFFYTETSFFNSEKIKPRIIDTAKRLVLIYISMTIIETILLRIGDMNWFDSICHSFATIATGGFSTKNTSIAEYSPYIQYIIMTFMYFSGINFFLYYFLFTGKFNRVYKNQELRFFSTIIVISSLLIALYLILKVDYQIEPALRLSFFQVISIVSCTGFSTFDYMLWPQIIWVFIFILMFLGASTGSTGGGIKIVRHLIILKKLKWLFRELLHPRVIHRISYNKKALSDKTIESVGGFIYLYILTFIIGSVIMVLLGEDVKSSIGAVATSMGGIGPGIGKVGPASNFSELSDLAKLFLPILMIAGRLELLSLFIVFTPSFWRK